MRPLMTSLVQRAAQVRGPRSAEGPPGSPNGQLDPWEKLHLQSLKGPVGRGSAHTPGRFPAWPLRGAVIFAFHVPVPPSITYPPWGRRL